MRKRTREARVQLEPEEKGTKARRPDHTGSDGDQGAGNEVRSQAPAL